MAITMLLGKNHITVTRPEANFDKACDTAYQMALKHFRVDEDGHSDWPGWERSSSSVGILFQRYGADGPNNHWYDFAIKAEKHVD